MTSFLNGINIEEIKKLQEEAKNRKPSYGCYYCGKTSTQEHEFKTKFISDANEKGYPTSLNVSLCNACYKKSLECD